MRRCRGCNDVIGVYEPTIVLADGKVRETSLLNEPSDAAGEFFHAECFTQSPITHAGERWTVAS
jgi:hypothetical protein